MSVFDVTPVSVADYRRRAKCRLPRFLFHYIDGGANDEDTMASNVSDFRHYHLKQRVMKNVDNIDISTMLAGRKASMPLALAPIGMAGMFARRGEVQAARAAKALGIPFTTSTVGICPVEEVSAATSEPFWFQLYMLRDRDLILKLLERAQAAGCNTLIFTVDLAVPGMRLRDHRNGMLGGGIAGKISQLAQIVSSPIWAIDVGLRGKPHNFGNLRDVVLDTNNLGAYKAFIESQFDPTVTWKDIAWLRSVWQGKILIKGVLEADDARAAIDTGADGVIVSNHGGRQLDGVASSVSKLAEVTLAVGNNAEVYLDGGIRSGIDIVKAIALGANGVLVGRPWVYAMSAKGETGIIDLISVFKKEITVAMALMGVNSIDEITADNIEIVQ